VIYDCVDIRTVGGTAFIGREALISSHHIYQDQFSAARLTDHHSSMPSLIGRLELAFPKAAVPRYAVDNARPRASLTREAMGCRFPCRLSKPCAGVRWRAHLDHCCLANCWRLKKRWRALGWNDRAMTRNETVLTRNDTSHREPQGLVGSQ
jgi:hypothetical protein